MTRAHVHHFNRWVKPIFKHPQTNKYRKGIECDIGKFFLQMHNMMLFLKYLNNPPPYFSMPSPAGGPNPVRIESAKEK